MAQNDTPTADDLLKQFQLAIADHWAFNRNSGTMAIPTEAKVVMNVNAVITKPVSSIIFDSNINRIVID